MYAEKDLDALIKEWLLLHGILNYSQDEHKLDFARNALAELNDELAIREVWLNSHEQIEKAIKCGL